MAVFAPSQLLNVALALSGLTPASGAPLAAWLPLACSALLMGALALAVPAAVMRHREVAMRREFLAAG